MTVVPYPFSVLPEPRQGIRSFHIFLYMRSRDLLTPRWSQHVSTSVTQRQSHDRMRAINPARVTEEALNKIHEDLI
jgi:hypothetical protein